VISLILCIAHLALAFAARAASFIGLTTTGNTGMLDTFWPPLGCGWILQFNFAPRGPFCLIYPTNLRRTPFFTVTAKVGYKNIMAT
jgi:hypothetical protein